MKQTYMCCLNVLLSNAVWTTLARRKNNMTILASDTVFEILRRTFAACNREQCGLMGMIARACKIDVINGYRIR